MEDINNVKKNIKRTLIISFFFVITLLIYGPYEIFITNRNDFKFTFLDFWWIPIISSVLYLIIVIILRRILPEKIAEMYDYCVFIFTFCCYIQAMFLNGKMKVLTGGNVDFDVKVKAVNILIWGIIGIAIVVFRKYYRKICEKSVEFVAFVIMSMQIVALISLLFSTDVLNQKKEGYLTTENMFNLSSEENNVVVFILDTFDEKFMNRILREEPTYLEKFVDFTYFPNATGTHSRTYPSITYLLTGEKCYFDKKPSKYVDEAFEKSEFFSKMISEDVNIGLYTYLDYIGNNARENVTNYMSSKRGIKEIEVQKSLLKMIMYRDLPYVFKKFFYYDVNEINYNVDKGIDAYKNSDDEWFYDQLINKEIQIELKTRTFRLYHLYSCHTDWSEVVYYGRRSLDIAYECIQQMKAKGVYDNSLIILTTDHASSGGGDTLDMPHETAVPLFLVKPIGKVDRPFTISNAPIAQEDFIPTVLAGLEIETDEKTIFEYEENDERERFYYYTALYSDEEGEVELREYKVVGDARNKENYEFTGNTWPVLYSLNKVKQ